MKLVNDITGLGIAGSLDSFVSTLARVSGVAVYFPIPWARPAGMPVRAALALLVTLLLMPAWPRLDNATPLAAVIVSEAALGVALGAVLAWLPELLLTALQMTSAQAGFSFASTVDPATQADSTVLPVLGQLAGSWLFLAAGADRELLRVLAASFEAVPPGVYRVTTAQAPLIIAWSGQILAFALRLALPVIVLLLMIDLALAVLGRIQPQLQLLTLSFPVKTLTAVWFLGALTASLTVLFELATRETFATAMRILESGGR